MNRRDLLQFCAAGAIAGLMTGVASAQESLVLKSADVHPVGYPTVAAVESMGKKLSEATDGRLTIEIYPSMQLGGEKETSNRPRSARLR